MPSHEHPRLLDDVRRIAREIAGPAAAEVDRDARFPHETLAALREARLLSAAVPVSHGGSGLGLAELAQLCAALAHGCGASAMVLAMHTIQVACIVRHAADSAFFGDYLRELAGWSLKFNSLKTTAAERAPEIVHGALQIVGILGYKNDTPFSLGRHYRDALSAALMISNDRIAAQSASMLLVFKDDQE